MREAAFVKKHLTKWKQCEKILRTDHLVHVSPDTMADLYIQITDDLSYSRTFYPLSHTTKYLNRLAAHLHLSIYENKRESLKRVGSFWGYELPKLFKSVHPYLLYSFLFFSVAVIIGAFSAAHDETFVRLILGDQYVNMTIENIKKDDPMAVYKGMHQMDMFWAITVNNIRVSFYAFAAGVIGSLGTVWILIQNGIMLGSFQYFFHQYGLLLDSALVIWIHGTLEISAIVIAGAAGITMGNGLLFPGTYPRMVSFKRGAIKGLKVIIGLIPIFIMAGFLESFVTRLTEMPTFMKALIILISLSFILFYFIYLPIYLDKKDQRQGS